MTNDQLVNQNSGQTEYGTPFDTILRAKITMGGIDLDPASNEIFNKTVNADCFYGKESNGLKQNWHGKIWLNHPFGRGEKMCKPNCKKVKCGHRIEDNFGVFHPADWRGHCITEDIPGNADWINKLVSEYEADRVKQACCITYNSSSELWFQPLAKWPQCLIVGRVKFLDLSGNPVGASTKGCVVTYLGPHTERFADNFRDLGEVKVSI